MKRLFFLTLLISTILGMPVSASQQPNDGNDLQTLGDYLRFASLNNAELKTKFEHWKAALEQIPQAKALDDPKFTYNYFIEEVETRVGPQRQKFGIMQVFPWFGKIEARTDVASAQAKAAHKQYEATKLKLFQQVKDTFYEYTYLKKATDIEEENLELLKHFEEIARIKYETATATHPDIIRAQVELAKLEDILKSLQELRQPTVTRINAILNRPPTSQLPWPKEPQISKIEIVRDKLIGLIITNNPELQGLNWEIEAAKSKVELAKKKFYPDIGVGVDWIQTDDAYSDGVRDSGKDPVVLMFSMNIPLWQNSYKAAERQAKANVSKTVQQKTNFENKTISQAINVLYDYEDSQRKTNLYGDTLVPKAEELLGASEAAYKAGKVDFLSLIDAQRMLLKYQLDYHRALTNHQQKLAELEMLAGVELQ
jgi:outer membrane protein TolC